MVEVSNHGDLFEVAPFWTLSFLKPYLVFLSQPNLAVTGEQGVLGSPTNLTEIQRENGRSFL